MAARPLAKPVRGKRARSPSQAEGREAIGRAGAEESRLQADLSWSIGSEGIGRAEEGD